MKARYAALAALAGFGLGAVTIQAIQAQAKPPAYAIAEIDVVDEAAFAELRSKNPQAVRAAGGKYLAYTTGRIEPIEGQAPKRIDLIMFENIDKALAWRDSAARKELQPLRQKAIKLRAFILEGMPN